MSTITDVVLSASRRLGGLVPAAAALLVLTVIPAHGQVAGVDLDTVRAGRFDFGKMWTFEYAPNEYFSETYGFDANDAWFERARLSVFGIIRVARRLGGHEPPLRPRSNRAGDRGGREPAG